MISERFKGGLFVIMLLAVVLCFPLKAPAQSLPKQTEKILILNSYNFGLSWTDTISKTFMQTLGSGYDYLIEFMDSKRYYSPEYFAQVAANLAYKYRNENFRLVMVSDNDAFNFMLEEKDNLFPGVPVVFCGVNYFSETSLSGRTDITGITENIIIRDTLRIALRQNPLARDIYVVVDNTTSGHLFRRLTEEALYGIKDEFAVHYLSDLPFDQLIALLARRQDGIVVCFPLAEDGRGKALHFDHAVHAVIQNSSMPIYTFWSMFMEAGAVGGYVVDPEYQGRRAAHLAQRILSGEDPGLIPVELDSGNYYTFNYAAMRRFGLPTDILPAGAVIINLPQSLRETNPQLFLSLLVTLSLLILVIVLLLLFVWRVRHENTQLERHVAERSQLIHQQEKHLMESEKLSMLGGMVSGIAHEINTPLGVSLTASSHLVTICDELHTRTLDASLTQNQFNDLVGNIRETSQVLHNNIERAGQLIRSFKKLAIDQSTDDYRIFRLDQCLDDLVLSLKHEYKYRPIIIELLCPEGLQIRSYPAAFNQIFSNLIMNSLLHGFHQNDNGKIRIEVTDERDSLCILYQDNGRGMSRETRQRMFEPFYTTARHNGGTGLGMSIVHNLVIQRLGGSIEADSEPGNGLRIQICIPLNNQ